MKQESLSFKSLAIRWGRFNLKRSRRRPFMEMNKLELHFLDSSGTVILRKKLIGLPLKESRIIEKSIEWFFDPEPCMIHRSAVMKRIYSEFFDYFEQLLKQKITEWKWANVPDHLKQMLDINMEISSVLLKQ